MKRKKITRLEATQWLHKNCEYRSTKNRNIQIPKEFRKDREFILEAVGFHGGFLKYADESLRKDKEIVLDAVRSYPTDNKVVFHEELQHHYVQEDLDKFGNAIGLKNHYI